jgi:hypothetical protein
MPSAERDAQEDDDDEGKPHPKPKVPPSYDWSHFFRGYIDTSWVDSQERKFTETQDTTDRSSSQASNGHPSLSGSNGRPLTRSGFDDVGITKYMTKRTRF